MQNTTGFYTQQNSYGNNNNNIGAFNAHAFHQFQNNIPCDINDFLHSDASSHSNTEDNAFMESLLTNAAPMHPQHQFHFALTPSQLHAQHRVSQSFLPHPQALLRSTSNSTINPFKNGPVFGYAPINNPPALTRSLTGSISPPRPASSASTVPVSPDTSLSGMVPQASVALNHLAAPHFITNTAAGDWPRLPSELIDNSTATLPAYIFKAGTGGPQALVRPVSKPVANPIAKPASSPATKPASKFTKRSKDLPTLPAVDEPLPVFTSLFEAKAWREKVRETMTSPSIPSSFIDDACHHVADLKKAMLDLKEARDGDRVVDGKQKRQSPGYKMIRLGNYEDTVMVSSCWLLFETLIKIHQTGSHLRRSQLPNPLIKPETEELGMTIQERLEAVIELLKKEKMSVKDVLDGGDREAMRTVRAPRSILEVKYHTRRLNDTRGKMGSSEEAEADGGTVEEVDDADADVEQPKKKKVKKA